MIYPRDSVIQLLNNRGLDSKKELKKQRTEKGKLVFTIEIHFASYSLSRNASVNSSSAHPPPPRANPRALAFFKKIGRIPRGGDEKRGQMPRPRDHRLPTLLQ